jgi:Ca-activated chloride channel family protein
MPYRSRLAISVTLAAALTAPGVAQACSERAMLLLIDASVSMRTPVGVDNLTRFEVARAAVGDFVDRYPPSAYLALRFYGAVPPGTADECRDSNLSVPFAPANTNRGPIKQALAGAFPRGFTPIAYALGEAVADFAQLDVDKVIVLVSDGIESCGGAPCAAAEQLAAKGFVINSIGFLVDDRARRELECVAKVSGGQYIDVRRPTELHDGLEETLNSCAPIALRGRDPFALG